jgi:hypothetical protein
MMEDADEKWGDFASPHEALGVCSEEWDELRAAIHANDVIAIERECLDLAAPLLRMAEQLQDKKRLLRREARALAAEAKE